MYVVKVGEYYVRKAQVIEEIIDFERTMYYIGEILLSKEMQGAMKKREAEMLAEQLNGEVIEITDEVTNEK